MSSPNPTNCSFDPCSFGLSCGHGGHRMIPPQDTPAAEPLVRRCSAEQVVEHVLGVLRTGGNKKTKPTNNTHYLPSMTTNQQKTHQPQPQPQPQPQQQQQQQFCVLFSLGYKIFFVSCGGWMMFAGARCRFGESRAWPGIPKLGHLGVTGED